MMKVIGIDFGLSKVGLAISDPSGIIALPLKVIRYKNKEDLLSELKDISKEKNVNKFVIGYPISMNYKENEMTKIIDIFKQDMENMNFEVILEDERLSSEYAKKIMIEQDVKVSRNKEMVDLTAASIILQTYLDRNKN
ncbi:MAG: Holliday junction resolvase RuvX [Candidatus Neomarinimicrobiota bacterium]|jgi:putative Holliday junction resolvase|nr:Holliday junction resolvase RuvX [Candidatus Neomarinimicrobiota bacterium]|tara:strand:+ start:7407 stop:7820 length:414 start_codon:yes stop_codon:yes gene_type:complete